MGRLQKKQSINEAFPDRSFTKDELREFAKAVEKIGGKTKWLASKGFLKLDPQGQVTAVVEFEGILGKEVIKGTGISYQSSIPYTFWNEVGFPQLDKYMFGITQGKKERDENLNEYAKKVGSTKKIKEDF